MKEYSSSAATSSTYVLKSLPRDSICLDCKNDNHDICHKALWSSCVCEVKYG